MMMGIRAMSHGLRVCLVAFLAFPWFCGSVGEGSNPAHIYEALSTHDDVVLFGKGLTGHRWGTFLGDTNISCQMRNGFSHPTPFANAWGSKGGAFYKCVFDNAVKTDAEYVTGQVIRCAHPPDDTKEKLLGKPVTIELNDELVQSYSTYTLPTMVKQTTIPLAQRNPGEGGTISLGPNKKKHLVCACLVLREKAEFLTEWVRYHFSIGVELLLVYDQKSTDSLEQWARWIKTGYNVDYYNWPYDETQPGFIAHAALRMKPICEWSLFTDIDEFIMVYKYLKEEKPLASYLLAQPENSGGVEIVSYNMFPGKYGPIIKKPDGGVVKNYKCRRTGDQRLGKVILRLDAMHPSTYNNVHNFCYTAPTYKRSGARRGDIQIFHFKYQAWEVFRKRHHSRISPMGKVFDFTGYESNEVPAPVFLKDWVDCVVNNTDLRDYVLCRQSYKLAAKPCYRSETTDKKELLVVGVAGKESGLEEMSQFFSKYQRDQYSLGSVVVDWKYVRHDLHAVQLPMRFRYVTHVVSHPLRAIASILQLSEEDWKFILTATPEVAAQGEHISGLKQAMQHWLSWNLQIETIADSRVNIDTKNQTLLQENCRNWKEFVHCPPIIPSIRSFQLTQTQPLLTWEALEKEDQFFADQIRLLAKKYGFRMHPEE